MIRSVAGTTPQVDGAAFVHAAAEVIGDVVLGPRSSVWPYAVVRADLESISVGAESNLQDGAVLHSDPGLPLVIGDRVTVGHQACLHGCTIESEVLVGIGARVLNGARVGSGSIIGAGALVPEGAVIPGGSLVLGLPGRVVREVSPEETERLLGSAARYVTMIAAHRGR